MPIQIDSHQHFWRFDPVEYDWIGGEDADLRRDYLPIDLHAARAATGISGSIAVQARQNLDETEWLLDLADTDDSLLGVVGWADLAAPDIDFVLDRFANRPRLRGLRHVVQAEPDGFLAGDAFNRGLSRLAGRGLVYDLLIVERQLPEAIDFVDRHPRQTFVLDHIAKPRIRAGEREPWALNLRRLARRENVFCKFSGLVTEADHAAWNAAQLRPYWETALAAFGPDRLMFGSDWPVCLLATDYTAWYNTVSAFAAELTESGRGSLFGATAARVYGV